MVKKILSRLIRRHHYWRTIGFDELSELYISMIFRSIAIGSIGVFVPVYLYKLGYPLAGIISVYAWYTTTQAVMSYGTARLVARYGPKHVILLSYLVQLISSALYLTQGQCHWPLAVLGIVWGVAVNLFFIPYHIDFSKIKHINHSGKEVGMMYIMQKAGLTVGPLLGGVVATIFGAQYVFFVACLLLIIGVLPLFQTREPIKTHQTLDFNNFPVQRVLRDFGSYAGLAAEDMLTKLLWPAYVGILVLGTNVYAKLGILSSASVAFSIFVTYIIGKLADKRRGRQMIRSFVVVNSLTHLVRPFVHTFAQTIGINMVNDTVTIGYVLPYTKGLYAAADDLVGHRIVYLASIEFVGNVSRAVTAWMLVMIAGLFSTWATLTIGFVLAAIASLIIATESFRALGKRYN